MLFSAGVVAVVMILTALFLVKRSPAEYGTEPYRTGDSKKRKKKLHRIPTHGLVYLKRLLPNLVHGAALSVL